MCGLAGSSDACISGCESASPFHFRRTVERLSRMPRYRPHEMQARGARGTAAGVRFRYVSGHPIGDGWTTSRRWHVVVCPLLRNAGQNCLVSLQKDGRSRWAPQDCHLGHASPQSPSRTAIAAGLELPKADQAAAKGLVSSFSSDGVKPLERVSKSQLGASRLISQFALCLAEIDWT